MRKGKYPGRPKSLVFDEKVWNGGASEGEVDELWEKRKKGKEGK